MKLWIDDIRTPPEGYFWCKTVNKARMVIEEAEAMKIQIELIDTDHDAGEFVNEGGDYIELLNWLERTGRNYPIRIHSMNPVGVQNMRAIIQHNGWREVR